MTTSEHDQTEQPWQGWAIVELMGHRRLAGYVCEQQVAGAAFLRLDIPGDGGTVATQLYSPAAVYCITPTTEATARKVASGSRIAPVQRWELPPAVDAECVDDDDAPY